MTNIHGSSPNREIRDGGNRNPGSTTAPIKSTPPPAPKSK